MPNLSKDGYIVVKNIIDTNMSYKCIEKNKLDYHCIYEIINRKYFPLITKQVPDTDNATFRRFIFSNNNYSSMDSLYHANSYNYSNTQQIPIYCAYIYFNDGILELIPGSHIKSNNMNYSSKIKLELNDGDVVIMNTNLHNRNIYNRNSKILKILDIFPNDEIKNEYSHNLIIGQLNNSFVIKYILFVLFFISKSEIIMNSINYIYYFLVFYNIQYKFLLENINSYGKLVSYEANNRKYIDEINGYENWNTFIICNTDIKTHYFGNNLTYFIIMCLLVYSLSFHYICKNKNIQECFEKTFEKYSPNNIKDFMTNYKIKQLINTNGNNLFAK